MREKGTNRQAFLQGRVDKYTWVDTGSSYLPSDMLAAFLLAQLESWEVIQGRRRELWNNYLAALELLVDRFGVKLPEVPLSCEQAYHLFYVVVASPEERDALVRHASNRGIECTFHYQPLHASEAGRRFGTSLNGCPNATSISQRLLRLPLHLTMTDADQNRVIDAVLSYYYRN
jgi:dTDP-4-amino-4,6-dideoxygalactose transaminase